MPEIVVNGCTLHYEESGSGVPVVLTPGGRWGGYVHRVVAAELAKDFRVITWDRRNSDGNACITIAGHVSEADIWADDLAGLIRALSLGPCYVGEYAGCRTTPLLCVKYPALVKGLLLSWPSGGEAPVASLPKNMYRPYIKAALRTGMKGVTEVDRFAASIKLNPSNRDTLLAMDPEQFVRQMGFWESFFNTSADLPTAGCRLNDDEWASIKVPATVTGGVDPIHQTIVAQNIHKLLPNSQYHDPVVTEAEWNKLFGKVPYPIVSDFQGERIAPVWRQFIKDIEGRG